MTEPNRERPTVLLECADSGATARQVEAFRDAGFDVLACPGPRVLGTGRCRLVEHGDCQLVEHADVVFHDLDLDRPIERAVLTSLRDRFPDLPVVVEVPEHALHRHGHTLAGATVVPPVSPEHVVRAARDAVASAPSTSPVQGLA